MAGTGTEAAFAWTPVPAGSAAKRPVRTPQYEALRDWLLEVAPSTKRSRACAQPSGAQRGAAGHGQARPLRHPALLFPSQLERARCDRRLPPVL